MREGEGDRRRKELRAAEVHGNMQAAMEGAARALPSFDLQEPVPMVYVYLDGKAYQLVCPRCGCFQKDLPARECRACGQRFLTN